MISKILRQLPAFKGKRRLGRILLKQYLNSEKDILIQGKHGCEFIIPNAQENIGFELLINGIYEEQTIDFITSQIPKYRTKNVSLPVTVFQRNRGLERCGAGGLSQPERCSWPYVHVF